MSETLEAGRETDALIAEKVMGWKRSIVSNYPAQMSPPDDDTVVRGVPYFSTDIVAAWQVVERLRVLRGSVGISWERVRWEVEAYDYWDDAANPNAIGMRQAVLSSGETAPLAICRAALAAVESATSVPNAGAA